MGCGIQVDTVHSFWEDNGAEASAATLKAHSPSLHPHLLPSALRVYADPAPKEQWEPSETASPSVSTSKPSPITLHYGAMSHHFSAKRRGKRGSRG